MNSFLYIEHDASGRIYASGSSHVESLSLVVPCVAGNQIKEVTASYAPNSVYWDGAKVVPKPTAPSRNHDFDYRTKQWVANPDKAWAAVRAERNKRLAASDWTQLGDVNDAAWLTYRQALRDITTQSNPFAITWPVAPA